MITFIASSICLLLGYWLGYWYRGEKAAQQGVQPTASGVFLPGFIIGLVVAAAFALVLFGGG